MSNCIIHQIYYNEKSKSKIDHNCIGYDNCWHGGKEINPFMENKIITELITDDISDDDYYGVLSWRFNEKRPVKLTNVKSTIELDDKVNLYTFYNNYNQKKLWTVAERWHKGCSEIADYIVKKLGYQNFKAENFGTELIIYSNYFITKGSFYKSYVKDFLVPAIQLCQTDEFLKEKLWVNTKYKNGISTKEDLIRMFGVDYYPLHPFVFERFPSTYFTLTGMYNFKHLC